ncbi:MAG: hypothetical protein WC825_02335 [Gallionellaceae bacterium]|jgi:hypothetical protein
MKFLAFVILLLSPVIAHCDQFSRFEYECAHLDAERDGVTCKITPDNIRGSYLWLKLHTTVHDAKERRERTSYIKDTVVHNYLVVGGTGVFQWVRNRKGIAVQRFCGKIKGQMEVFCNEWEQIPDDEKARWR